MAREVTTYARFPRRGEMALFAGKTGFLPVYEVFAHDAC